MTEEINKLANDPEFVVQFAVGDPAPELVPQDKKTVPRFSNVFFNEPKRYVLKSAHMSREDIRIFDVECGRVVLVSHHPGKNPYEELDPLGMGNQGNQYKVQGGEWESVCDVTGRAGFKSFKIRPKTVSRHGRQNVKIGDRIVFHIEKMGKFKTMSLRDHFVVGLGEDGEMAYKLVADMVGRSVAIFNEKEELVAQMAKTNQAMMMTAVFGGGSESTIDIAPGVDCSMILAAIMGMNQVGEHFLMDVFNNLVADPLKDQAVDSAVETAGLGSVVDAYNNASGGATRMAQKAKNAYNMFFK